MSRPPHDPPGLFGYLVLALVCATALLAGTIEVMLVPLYHGATVLPITVLLGMATTFALPRLGIWLTRTPSGGFLPLACWFVAVLGLAFIGRPEGDVLVEGGNAQQWVLFVLIIASAVVGFVTVVRSTEALAPVRQPDGPPVSR